MINVRFLGAIVAVSLLLAACGGVTIEFDDRVDVRGTTYVSDEPLRDAPTDFASLTIPGGGEVVVEFRVPASDRDALFVYLDENLPMYVHRASGSLFATSRSDAFFGAGREGLARLGATSALAPAIVAPQTCPGSCVITENTGSGRYFVRVVNPGGTRTVSMWSVLRDFDDENEAYDADRPMPIFESGFRGASGALETLDDVDHYRLEAGGAFYIDFPEAERTGIEVIAELFPVEGSEPFVLRPGEPSFPVSAGDRLRVYATNDRAAVSDMSFYSLGLE